MNEKDCKCTVTEKPAKGLFTWIWNASEELMDAVKLPLRMKACKRGFVSAYDDATNKIIDLEAKIDDYRKHLVKKELSADILNNIFEAKSDIKLLKEEQENILEEYEIMFDKKMNIKDED